MKIFTFAFALLLAYPLLGQHTINQSSGKISFYEVNSVTFEGHSGSEIIISPENGHDFKMPERAAGLKLISAGGLEDNTGIGLSVKTEGNETTVAQLSSRGHARYIVQVPAGVAIYYECSTHAGKTVITKDLESELEISANFNHVKLHNAQGPLAVSTVHGTIEAEFSSINQDQSISLHSVHNHVDVSVPSDAKANFRLSTSWGEMFTDLDLDYEQDSALKKISSKKMEGKFNGGGVDFSIKSTHDDIYLRKI